MSIIYNKLRCVGDWDVPAGFGLLWGQFFGNLGLNGNYMC